MLYSTFKTSDKKRLGFDLGLRVSYFEEEKDYFFEPRGRIWFQMNDHFNLSLSSGQYYQFLSPNGTIALFRRSVLDWVDEIEREVLSFPENLPCHSV